MRRMQLIPSADLAPPSISHLTPRERARLWAQMVDEGDRLVFEGFLRRSSDEAAARRAFDDWLSRRDADSTAAKIRILKARRPTELANGR
ncbi:MAG: hypothetical protein ACKOEX_05575 [Planctomycetia bacterium]